MGQSVLLPVSYRVNSSLLFPLSIVWKAENSSQVIIICMVRNCSLDAWGAPKKCSAISFPHITYWDRAEVFPENASLLLRDLQLSDSGVYSIAFTQQNLSRQITLAVHKQHGSTERPDKGRCPCAWTDSSCIAPAECLPSWHSLGTAEMSLGEVAVSSSRFSSLLPQAQSK